MDSGKHFVFRRGLFVVTCRPDGRQELNGLRSTNYSQASVPKMAANLGHKILRITRTEARVVVPTRSQRGASDRGNQGR